MNIMFLSSLFPNELRDDIRQKSIGPIANANDTLQWAIVEGISNFHEDFSVINAPNVGAFPLRYKALRNKLSFFKIPSNNLGINISFFNLLGIKHFSRYFNIKSELQKWIKKETGEKVIIIYDLHPPFLLAVRAAKKIDPSIKTCLVVPDLHGLTGGPKSIIYKLFGKIEKSIIDNSLLFIDNYVLLSEFMKEHLPIGNKPYTVVEGIYSKKNERDFKILNTQTQEKILFYSGALETRNGILTLIDAFGKINKPNYKLIICGDGGCRYEIEKAVMNDARIIYKGQKSRDEVLELQRSSTLLINPRQPEGEFTRYSFPSKTMEYYASGVPTLMYKLEGIPKEYYNYCYSLNSLSIESLATQIVRICEEKVDILLAKGESARQFIVQYKNPKHQVGKILALIDNNFSL